MGTVSVAVAEGARRATGATAAIAAAEHPPPVSMILPRAGDASARSTDWDFPYNTAYPCLATRLSLISDKISDLS